MTNIKDKNKIIGKRTIIGSFIFGIALWFYTSLNGNYTTYINAPISVILPENRALEKPLPETISIQVKGSGWNIFNLMFFNNSKKILVNLSSSSINDSIYRIGRNEIIKGAQSFERVELNQTIPESVEIYTGIDGVYNVPLISQVEIIPKNGFSLVGNISMEPTKIRISGNDKVVSKIPYWTTKREVFENVNSPFTARVELTDSISDMVSLGSKDIQIFAEVQQTGEITITEIPISFTGGDLPSGHFIYPGFVTVTLRGGIEEVDKVSSSSVKVSIDFSTIINDTRGVLKPTIEIPENLEVIKVEPPFIYHTKKTRIEKLTI